LIEPNGSQLEIVKSESEGSTNEVRVSKARLVKLKNSQVTKKMINESEKTVVPSIQVGVVKKTS
jgi:hypothetical protein